MIEGSKLDVKKGILLTLMYAFLMAVSTASTKHTQSYIGVYTLIFWQSVLCSLIVLPQLKSTKIRKFKPVWKLLFLRSLGGFSALVCYYFALNHIPIVEASLLRTCAPLCVPFVVLLLHKKLIPLNRLLPLLVGFSGVLIVMHPSPDNISIWHLVAFLSAVGLALSMVTTRIISHYLSANQSLFIYFTFSAVFSFLLAIVNGNSIVLPEHSWGWVLAVSISLYFGLYLYTLAYTYAPASIISPVSYIGIAFNALFGWIIWRQIPDAYTWTGGVFIILSIWITSRVSVNR